METVSVMEGDSVTLHTDITEIKNDDTILWMFGPKGFVISQITRKKNFTSFFITDDDVGGRLQVNQNTGSLTIRNTRIRHSGQYKLNISREKTTTKIFSVTVFDTVGETDGVNSVSVMEGHSVTLHTDLTETHTDLIVWRFGDKGILLAKFDVETNKTTLSDADERFRDRLQLDQTGSLTITNTRIEHAGFYEVHIRGHESLQRFLLTVTAVPDCGLSPGEIAGIVVTVLLVLVAVGFCCYSRTVPVEEMPVSAIEGQSVELPTDVSQLQKDDKIQWWYLDENNLIAETNEKLYEGTDGRFRNKLTMDSNTGKLTINNIRTLHAGLYKLKISSKKRTKYKRFIVTVNVKTISVEKGGTINLKTGAKIQTGDLILWTFGAENHLVKMHSNITDIDEKFRGRLDLDKETGSLTITNITPDDIGHYHVQIISGKQAIFRRFNVITGTSSTQEEEQEEEHELQEIR